MDPDTKEIASTRSISFTPSDRGAGNWPMWFCEKAEQCGVAVHEGRDGRAQLVDDSSHLFDRGRGKAFSIQCQVGT